VVEPRGRNEIGGLATADRWKWTKQGLPCHTASWSGRVRRGGCAERCTFSGVRKRGDDGQPQERSDDSTRPANISLFVGRFPTLRQGRAFGLWIPTWTLGFMPVLVTGARVSHGPRDSGGGVRTHGDLCGAFRFFGRPSRRVPESRAVEVHASWRRMRGPSHGRMHLECCAFGHGLMAPMRFQERMVEASRATGE